MKMPLRFTGGKRKQSHPGPTVPIGLRNNSLLTNVVAMSYPEEGGSPMMKASPGLKKSNKLGESLSPTRVRADSMMRVSPEHSPSFRVEANNHYTTAAARQLTDKSLFSDY